MSILIHGMEMPQDCDSCVFCENEMFQKYCPLSDNYYDWGESSTGNRPSDCPLVPLPEGHGRLIDGDALFEKMYRLSDNEGAHKDSRVDDALILRDSACYLIEDAPTIVPAEGGGEDG